MEAAGLIQERRAAVSHRSEVIIGIDVGDQHSSVCVLDATSGDVHFVRRCLYEQLESPPSRGSTGCDAGAY